MTARKLIQTVAAIRARRLMLHLRGIDVRAAKRKQPTTSRQVYPRHLELAYTQRLLPMVREAHRLVVAELVPALPLLLQEAQHERGDALVRRDAWDDHVSALMRRARDQLARVYPEGHWRDVANGIAKLVDGHQREQLQRVFKNIVSVNVFGSEPQILPRVRAFVAENVALIKSIPTRAFDEVEQRVLSGVRSGSRVETIASDVQERFEVSESRATLIARDQVGKFYGELNKVRQENLGIDGYVWRTSNDERVRDAHVIREGKRFSWDDPPYDGHPGEPVQCRCWADPDIDSLLTALEGDTEDDE